MKVCLKKRDLDWADHVDVKSPLKDTIILDILANMRLIYSFSGTSKTLISSEEERIQKKSWIILSSSDLLGKLILFSI